MFKKIMRSSALALMLTVSCSSFGFAVPADQNKSREQVERQIEELDNRIENVIASINDSKKQIVQAENDIQTADKQVNEAQQKIDKENDLYKERIRAMYINGMDDYITLLFNAKSFNDLLLKIQMVESMIKNNKEVMDMMVKSQNEINDKKKALSIKKDKLVSLKSDNEKKLASMNKDKASQTQLLQELKSQEKLYAEDNDKAYNDTMKQISDIRSKAPRITPSRGALNISGNNIIAYATNFLGTKYVWGGSTPTPGFDCSGYTQYVFAHFGISLGRTTYAQINNGAGVSKSQLQPGDLVFFGTWSNPHHVGIYVGNNMYIHSPRTGEVIKVSSMDRGDFLTGRRVN